MRLNFFGSVRSQAPHFGHFTLNSFKNAVCFSKVRASGASAFTQIFS